MSPIPDPGHISKNCFRKIFYHNKEDICKAVDLPEWNKQFYLEKPLSLPVIKALQEPKPDMSLYEESINAYRSHSRESKNFQSFPINNSYDDHRRPASHISQPTRKSTSPIKLREHAYLHSNFVKIRHNDVDYFHISSPRNVPGSSFGPERKIEKKFITSRSLVSRKRKLNIGGKSKLKDSNLSSNWMMRDSPDKNLMKNILTVWTRMLQALRDTALDITYNDLLDVSAMHNPPKLLQNMSCFIGILLGLDEDWNIVKKTVLKELRPVLRFMRNVSFSCEFIIKAPICTT
jgi:hypothetical protein